MPRASSIKCIKSYAQRQPIGVTKMSKKKQKPQPFLTHEEFVAMKKEDHQKKKLRKQVQNNIKSQQGFGYDYKPIQFDYSENS